MSQEEKPVLGLRLTQSDLAIYVFIATAPAWMLPLGNCLAFSSYRWISLIGAFLVNLELIYAFVMLGAIAVFLSSPLLLFFKRYRRYAMVSLVLSVTSVVCFTWGLAWERFQRFERMEQVLERGQPIVEAVTAFEKKNGHPPATLNELVPDYLEAIPTTGIGSLPEYHYKLADAKNALEGNDWILIVHPPALIMTFDSYKYFPRQNYPEGSILVGSWIYRRRG